MVSAGDAILAVAGAAAVSEATGVTNLAGDGGQESGRSGGGSSGGSPVFDFALPSPPAIDLPAFSPSVSTGGGSTPVPTGDAPIDITSVIPDVSDATTPTDTTTDTTAPTDGVPDVSDVPGLGTFTGLGTTGVTDAVTDTTDAVTGATDAVTDAAGVTDTTTPADTRTPTDASDAFTLQSTADDDLGLGDVPALIGEAGQAAGEAVDASASAVNDAAGFVQENPIATTGVAAGVAAAPFTGGASVPIGLAGAGAAGEVGADLATGQYGDPSETVNDVGREAAAVGEGVVSAATDVTDAATSVGPIYKGPDPLGLGPESDDASETPEVDASTNPSFSAINTAGSGSGGSGGSGGGDQAANETTEQERERRGDATTVPVSGGGGSLGRLTSGGGFS